MSKRQKRQISRELTAIASLRDSDIDTSDIPEITDWSRAVVSKAYQSTEAGSSRSVSSVAAFTLRQLPDSSFGAQPSPGKAAAEMTEQQLIAQCLVGQVTAWDEFMRRWSRLMAEVVLRTARRFGKTSPELVDDLVRETYLKLCANDFQFLRAFQPRHENAFVGYLKVVTANVVRDYFRSAYSTKRAIGFTSVELNLDPSVLGSSGAVAGVEKAVLMEEIDRVLKTIASERERAIFWLYYRDGLSAKTIASLPPLRLTVKGIESVIFRLTKTLRRELAQALPAHQSQRGTAEILRETRPPKKKND